MLDYKMNRKILRMLGIYPEVHNLIQTVAWIAKLKSCPLYRSLIQLLRTFCIATAVVEQQHGGDYLLEKSYGFLRGGSTSKQDKVEDSAIRLEKAIEYLRQESPQFQVCFERMIPSKIRIAILAATSTELASLYRTASLRDCLITEDIWRQGPTELKKCVYLQNMDYELYLLKIGKGPVTAAKTLATWESNITFDYIIAGGICAGIYPDRQELRDIIVSEQVQDLCDQKLENGRKIQRGRRQEASQYLLDKMAMEHASQQNRVSFGLVLSGPILANDPQYMQELRTVNAGAIL